MNVLHRLFPAVVVTVALTVFFPALTAAQPLKIPDQIERLAVKAKEIVNVTLDGTLLQTASQFLNSNDGDDRQVKSLISKLKSIHVRSFEFANAGEYSEADVAAYRSQLKSPAWSRIVDTLNHEDGEHVEVFAKQENGQVSGLAIIAAEPKELTIVSIDGMINLAQLASMGGQFGIPKIKPGK